MKRAIHVNTVIGHHLVLHGYGQWLGNDPRGSGSTKLRQEKFADLGPVHFGRKRQQPSKQELRDFYREAEPRLEHETIWFDERDRIVIAFAFEHVVKTCGYAVWSCAVLQNHAHLVLRIHRDDGHLMWEHLAFAARDALRRDGLIPHDHPAWSNRPYVVFKRSVIEVRSAIKYVNDNPEKHGLPRQSYPWVVEYDGFPFHKKRK